MTDVIIPMGRFGAAHGVKGWIKVISHSVPSEKIFEYQPWYLFQSGCWSEIKISDRSLGVKKITVLPEGVQNRNEIKSWINVTIGVLRSVLPCLSSGYYWQDLMALKVKNTTGYVFGEVTDLIATGANDVLLVSDPRTKDRHLIPFVQPHIVKFVDLTQECIFVDWELFQCG